MSRLASALLVLAVAASFPPANAEDGLPIGVLAAAAGNEVVLADPRGGSAESFTTGAVGWLYPAPGGLLFAPALVEGRTTVFDLRERRLAERLDGVTMPVFGRFPDRYAVAAGDVMLFSYPGRALLADVEAGIEHAWKVLLIGNDTGVLVLERRPDGSGPESLVRVDLVSLRASDPWPLTGDVMDIALSPELGLLALADHDGGVQILDAAHMTPVASWRVSGRPRAVAFAGEGDTLVAAAEGDAGGGMLSWARIKTGRKGLRLAGEEHIVVDGEPVDIAVSPDGRSVVVAEATGGSGRLEVIDLKHGDSSARIDLDAPPRSVVWCDPFQAGPLQPEWSEGIER